ncbi:MAG TPA: DNA polymerase IV [Gammaproteobacteria bacterium]|nr:DNA polymerase IV [Gammaproteobacteria bacterium]
MAAQQTPPPEAGGDSPRRIIHIDMDAFYAAIEQRDHPGLRGRPVVVGGDPGGRGVVATCSYEAREYGIHSAMPAARARRLCPKAVFLRPRFDAYRRESARIFALLREYTSLVEPLALDEAYLDVSGPCREGATATGLAREIRARVRELTGLVASAGVSYNKFLAKLASDMDKPDGLCVITPERGPGIAASLPVGRFHGIGRATEAKLRRLGIRTGADLGSWTVERLRPHLGVRADYFHQLARGIDTRPVRSHRLRKSLGTETTFARDLHDREEMLRALEELAGRAGASLRRRGLEARTLTVKVRFDDFRLVTRSRRGEPPYTGEEPMRAALDELLDRALRPPRPVRLLGVTFSLLQPADSGDANQLDLL